ncbi:MAG: hypothetical protein R8G66_16460 [Cytophagales bacterium]|nr:hypothetical protein [Cytophagales bacterium]
MNASNQIETIDAYLRGELTPAEVSNFEAQLEKDPSLAEELAFQKQVVSGIQQARKLQLKNRLAQVDVAGGSVAGQSTWLKVAGGVVLATLIGVVTWQLLPEEASASVAGEIDAPTFEVREIPVIEVPEKTIIVEAQLDQVAEGPKAIKVIVPEPVPSDESTTITPVETEEASEDNTVFAPQVDLPADESELDSSEFEPEDLEETFSNTVIESSDIDALNIERLDQKAKSLRYRYYDGKLALYGDFGDSPYQILEINQQDGGKQIFLFHADQYYRLESTKEEKKLDAIKDAALLSELQVFQNKK